MKRKKYRSFFRKTTSQGLFRCFLPCPDVYRIRHNTSLKMQKSGKISPETKQGRRSSNDLCIGCETGEAGWGSFRDLKLS